MKAYLDRIQNISFGKGDYTMKKTISILHSQEQPIPFENRYESLYEVIAGLITENLKIYVIDSIEYSTMLFANEY